MRFRTKEFKFHNIYIMASMIEECAINHRSFVELIWDQEDTLEALVKPAKQSLLHQYIFAIISVEEHNRFQEKSDIYWDTYDNDDSGPSIETEIDEDFHAYGIEFEPFPVFVKRIQLDENDDWFYKWFLSQKPQFEELWNTLTDEVFHILFANRSFLLSFNQSLAKYLHNNIEKVPVKYLNDKGVLKRASHLPTWLRKAVFYRDQGRCVLCQRDLSGLLSTDRTLHFDHIVPLKMWGTNDPSNFQLLCDVCNLKKSGNVAISAYRYAPWWDY